LEDDMRLWARTLVRTAGFLVAALVVIVLFVGLVGGVMFSFEQVVSAGEAHEWWDMTKWATIVFVAVVVPCGTVYYWIEVRE
jgi:hypothetical protein